MNHRLTASAALASAAASTGLFLLIMGGTWFWGGLGAAQAGDLERGVAEVRQAIAMHPGWRPLLERLPADVAPSAQAVLARLRADE